MKTKIFQTKTTSRFFLATSAVLSFLIMSGWMITSVRANTVPYDENELQKLKSFLESKSMSIGKTNADVMGVDINNPGTWAGWIDKVGTVMLPAQHVVEIKWKSSYLAGSLDISNFDYLGYLNIYCYAPSNFDNITITNNANLQWGVDLHSVWLS